MFFYIKKKKGLDKESNPYLISCKGIKILTLWNSQ